MVENRRSRNCGQYCRGWKMWHTPLWTAKRTLSTTLANCANITTKTAKIEKDDTACQIIDYVAMCG